MLLKRTLLAIATLAVLAACESDEDRAAGHFASGTDLYEAGDVDRALVELRNVLSIDENHKEARLLFARISTDSGNMRQGMDSYLRIVEQYPDTLEGRIELAEFAAFTQSWDEAERHGRAALELAPEDLDVQAVNAVLDYRKALIERDDAMRTSVLNRAEALVLERPDSVILRNILVDGRNWQGDTRGALEQVDAAIALEPDHKPLYFSKLSILGTSGDEPGIEAHLREMVTRFPDDEDIKGTLIRYLIETGDLGKAEAFFRDVADPNAAEVGPYVAFVRFISETRGREAAIAELEATAATSAHPFVLRAMQAGLKFDIGQQDIAIGEMEAVLEDGPPIDIAGNLRVALARMMVASGNEVGARLRVEEVLEAEPGNAEALKMQSNWLVEADQTDAAISVLREALDQAPGDVEGLTLLARAYSRAGSHELSRDTLAQAVVASNNAPEPTLRYSSVLIEENQFRAAESILVDALRNQPENLDLLSQLGRVYLLDQDFSRGGGVVNRLEAIGTEQSLGMAENMRLSLLSAQRRTDELLDVLEAMVAESDADTQARALLIRTRLASGDVAGALEVAEEALAADPGNADARLTYAATLAASGDFAAAADEYRAIIDEGAPDGRVYRLLTDALLRSDDDDGARAVLEAGLAAFPQDIDMLWMSASLLEQDGDIDGAIEVYESLYASNSDEPIIANNLASLLATWRADSPPSIERAFEISRRLRGTDVPAFQDTYGWIQHLRGNSEQAVEYLEPAAAALTADPIVQYHFGMALLAAGQTAEAADQLRLALELVGEGDSRPQFETARAELARLGNPTSEETINEN